MYVCVGSLRRYCLLGSVALAVVCLFPQTSKAGFSFELGAMTEGSFSPGSGFNTVVETAPFLDEKNGHENGRFVQLAHSFTAPSLTSHTLEPGQFVDIKSFGLSLTFGERRLSQAEVDAAQASTFTVALNLISPLLPAGPLVFTASSIVAEDGPTVDTPADLTIRFTPVTFSIGPDPSNTFRIALNDLVFDQPDQTLTLAGRISLLGPAASPAPPAVPEPGSLAIAGLGLAGLGWYQRRRKQQASA